ncbi:MAG: hypothetical protein ACOCYB_07825 [Alkalispirochaeta sp.]
MGRKQDEELVARVQQRLEQDHVVPDPSKISVKVERRGSLLNRETVVAVYGTIGSEPEGTRIMNSVNEAIKGDEKVEVENHLVVPLV